MPEDFKQFKHLSKHAHRCHANSDSDHMDSIKDALELSKIKNCIVEVWFDNYSFAVPIKPSGSFDEAVDTYNDVSQRLKRA